MANEQVAHFEIDASVVFQLGEQLISDEFQALLELIKNSYDADASFTKVTIDTTAPPPKEFGLGEKPGYVLLEDDGTGMTEMTIRAGWLTISLSPKRLMKAQGKKTVKGRTPLGDKGLGRLAVQRIGNQIVLRTLPKDADHGYHVHYNWKDFRENKLLSEVAVPIRRVPARELGLKSGGTKLLIADLVLENLDEQTLGEQLVKGLSGLVNPFTGVQDFDVVVKANGTELDLPRITRSVIDDAVATYHFEYDGKQLREHGAYSLDFIEPENRQEREEFERLVRRDEGRKFWAYLEKKGFVQSHDLTRSSKSKMYLEWAPPPAAIPFLESDDPGSFITKWYIFDLGRNSDFPERLFKDIDDYRAFIKNLSGVHVYRNGFEVRMGNDWLGFGHTFTSGRSHYAIRPSNVIGYVALSSLFNANLIEKTDREGFVKNRYFDAFQMTMEKFRDRANVLQGLIRREWIEYRNGQRQADTGNELPQDAATIAKNLRQKAVEVQSANASFGSSSAKLEEARQKVARIEHQLVTTLDVSPNIAKRISSELQAIAKPLQDLQKNLAALPHAANSLEFIEKSAAALQGEIDVYEERLSRYFELMGLGLAVEAFHHETANLLDRIESQLQVLRKDLQKVPEIQPSILHVEQMDLGLRAIRQQLAHISPTVQGKRRSKESIPLGALLEEMRDFHNRRLVDDHIEIHTVGTDKEIQINANRGRLVQILDNLILNSSYWVQDAIRRGKVTRGSITLKLDGRSIEVIDNGPGVDESVAKSLFEPFISTKPGGRGLGLYIARSLAHKLGGDLVLTNHLNKNGRHDTFRVTLEAAD